MAIGQPIKRQGVDRDSAAAHIPTIPAARHEAKTPTRCAIAWKVYFFAGAAAFGVGLAVIETLPNPK